MTAPLWHLVLSQPLPGEGTEAELVLGPFERLEADGPVLFAARPGAELEPVAALTMPDRRAHWSAIPGPGATAPVVLQHYRRLALTPWVPTPAADGQPD